MTLVIEQTDNWNGKYLRIRNDSYSMKLNLWLTDIVYFLENPDAQRWGCYSNSNDINSTDKEKIIKYIYENKLLKPVSYARKLYHKENLLKAYPLEMLLKYIKRSKIRSRYGELLNKAVSGT